MVVVYHIECCSLRRNHADDYEFKIEFKEAKEKEDEAAGNAAEKQLKDEEAANEENKEQ